MKQEVLRYENIHCSDYGKSCMNGVFFRAFEGEVCGVMVNNMREKEYFLQLLQGTMKATFGWTFFEENKVTSAKGQEFMLQQIAFVSKEQAIFRELSVAENIFVANGTVLWWQSVHDLCKDAKSLLDSLEVHISPDKKAYMLDVGEMKQVELLRSYVAKRKIVVISDIGIVMTEKQIEEFFQLVGQLKRRGMTFIYLSNGATRLFRYADEITVIKDGRTIGYMQREHYSRSTVYTQLYGEKKKSGRLENTWVEHIQEKKKVMECKAISLWNLPELNFSLCAGEIVNILDLVSSDCSKILEILQGESRIKSGQIYMNQREYSLGSIHKTIRNGVAFIEAKPLEQMVFMEMTVLDNLIFMLYYKKRGVFARKKKYKKVVENLLSGVFTEDELKSKVYAVSQECRLKLLYYRWILVRPKVLVCVRPFASVDFQMRQLTVDLIHEVSRTGIAVIIVTTQVSEAYTMKGHVITLNNDKVDQED